VPVGAAIPVFVHVHEEVVQPDAFVSAVRAMPPIAVRSAVTVLILLLPSATVQVSVVFDVDRPAVMAPPKEQPVVATITGATFDTVRDALPVPVSAAVKLSFAVTIMG
jgi:hypothetical protein